MLYLQTKLRREIRHLPVPGPRGRKGNCPISRKFPAAAVAVWRPRPQPFTDWIAPVSLFINGELALLFRKFWFHRMGNCAFENTNVQNGRLINCMLGFYFVWLDFFLLTPETHTLNWNDFMKRKGSWLIWNEPNVLLSPYEIRISIICFTIVEDLYCFWVVSYFEKNIFVVVLSYTREL